MSDARRVVHAFLLLAFLTCCSSPKQMDREDLKSSARELASIAAEGQLFAEFVAGGHATSAYIKAHSEYLKQLAASAMMKLATAQAGPVTEKVSLMQLQTLAERLERSWNAISEGGSNQTILIKLGYEFALIAESAKQIGDTL